MDMFNLTQFCLEKNAKEHPDKIALLLVEKIAHEQCWTYSQLYDVVTSLSVGLNSLGLSPGSRLVIHSEKNIDFMLLFFAAILASLVPIATLADMKKEEVQYIIDDCSASLYYDSTTSPLNISLPEKCLLLTKVDLFQWKKEKSKRIAIKTKKNDPAYIVYTSGSTGKPKGVIHAHRSIIGREPIRKYWLDLKSKDVVLVTGKLCWTYSIGVGLMDTWSRCATSLVYVGEVRADTWFKLIVHYKVTIFSSNPFHLSKMLTADLPELYDFSSVRHATSAGVALSYKIIEYWQRKFNITIYEALGMTEMSTFISSGPNIPVKKGKVGKIQPSRKVAVFSLEDNSTEPLPAGEVGLLAVHSSNLGFMLGYLNSEDSSKKFRGEWFITGDLVSKDSESYIEHMGRYDDIMILEKGSRVSPVEIESLLVQHDKILEAACILVKKNGKELIAGLVRLKDITQQTEEIKEDIVQFVKSRIVSYKVPGVIIFVEDFPRNSNGKIVRSALKKLI